MLIGTTVLGLQRMMRLIRLAQKQREREEKRNQNIYETIISEDANQDKKTQEESYKSYIVNLRENLEQEKQKYISWMAMNDMLIQANNNIAVQNIEQEQSFAAREAQRLAAQRESGLG